MEPKTRRAPLRLDALPEILEQPIEDPAGILEVLLSGLQRGQPVREPWGALHRAAVRDDKLSEVAFAYEGVVNDRRWSKLPPAQLAELLLQAGVFFESCFGDPEGAESYLERLVKVAPAHAEGFPRLEKLLLRRQAWERLSDLYSAAAGASDKSAQKELFQKAAAAAESLVRGTSIPPPGASQPPPSAKPRPLGKPEEKMLAAYQQIVKLDPTDTVAWKSIETLLRRAGRANELAKVLEQRLGSGLSEDEETDLREQLVGLYESLREPERLVPHAEVVLSRRPESIVSRRAAEALTTHRVLGPRVGLALAAAYERLGQHAGAADALQAVLEVLRGPKRVEAQRRLASLRFEVLGDLAGALAMFEQVVLAEPSDDDARRKYVQIADALGKTADAVKVLGRALAAAREPETKAMVQLDLGLAVVDLARGLAGPAARTELRRAATALAAAMEGAPTATAIAAAARAARGVAASLDDSALLAASLERLGAHDDDEPARAAARLQLAELRLSQGDAKAAVPVLRSLFGTELEREALIALEPIVEAEGDPRALGELLERRAALETDAALAERLSLRLIDVRGRLEDGAASVLDALRAHVARFGSSVEVLTRLAAALEAEKAWGDLADALGSLAELQEGPARAPTLLRRGNVLEKRLGREPDALESFAGALEADPADRAARAAVERYLRLEGPAELSLAAADRLEGLLRAEGGASLQRLLDVRGALAPTAELRLAALRELVEAPNAGRDPKHAVWVAVQGLASAIAGRLEPEIEPWVARVERATDADPRARAEALAGSAGEAPHDGLSPAAWVALVRRAAEAFARAGDVGAALAWFRRALALDEDPELVARVDELLAEQGKAEDRLALYQNLLRSADGARRLSLLHKIGRLQRHDLLDTRAALETYRALRAEAPGDVEARAAVLDLLEGSPEELLAALEEERAAGATDLDERIARVAVALGRPERAADAFAAAIGSGVISAEGLAAAEALGGAVRPELRVLALRALVGRQPAAAEEVDLRVRLADALEAVDARGEAREQIVRAAEVAEASLDDAARAATLLERALAGATEPEPTEAVATSLIRLLARAAEPERLARAHRALVESAASEAVAAARLAAMDEAVSAALGVAPVEAARRAWLDAHPGGAEIDLVLARALARAGRVDEAARLLREVAERPGAGDGRAVAALEALVAERKDRLDDREWLLERAVAAASEGERTPARVRLARFLAEERARPDRAADVLHDVPEAELDEDALDERARCCEAAGRAPEAIGALRALADRRAGAERAATLERIAALEIASGNVAALDELLLELLRVSGLVGPARELALRLLADERAEPAALDALERWGRDEADAGPAAAALDLLLERAAGAPAERRLGWYERRLELASDDDEALPFALRALAEQPTAFALWDRAEALARGCRREAELAQAYRRALDLAGGSTDDASFEELVGRAMAFHDDVLGDPDASTALLRRVVEHELSRSKDQGAAAELPAAFDRLVVVYSGREQWGELFSLYDLALDWVRSPARRVELLRDASEVARDVAHDVERAVRYLLELVRLKPDARVRASLERLLERTGRHAELVRLLDEQADATTGVGALRVRAASLSLDTLGDAAGAVARLERLEDAAWEERSVAEDAVALLERVLGAEVTERLVGAGEAPPSAPRVRSAKLLARHHRAHGAKPELLRALSAWLDSAELGLDDEASSARRFEVLEEVVSLSRELGDEARAALALADAVVARPSEATAAEAERALLARGEGRMLAETLLAAARRPQPAGSARALLARAAAAFEELPDGLASAIELRRELATLSEDDPAELLLAVRKLDRLLERAGRTQDLCAVLERLAGLEQDPAEKRRALVELSRLATSLGDGDAALRALRGRLAIDPGDAEAADLRVELLSTRVAAAGAGGPDAKELCDALLTRGADADLPRAAGLLEGLGDPAGAARVWRDVLARRRAEERPEESEAVREAVDALAGVLERAGSHAELVEHLEESAARTTERGRAAQLHRRVGGVFLHVLDRPGDALDALVKGLGLGDPASVDAIEELVASLCGRLSVAAAPALHEVLERASRSLLSAYVEHERLERARWLLERRREAAADDAQRAAAEVETARFLAAHAAPTSRSAASLFADALRRHPTEATAREAARMIAAGQSLEAVRSLGEVLEEPNVAAAIPQGALAELRLCVVRAALAQDGGLDVADRVLDRALRDAPDEPSLRLARVDVERQRGQAAGLRAALLHAAEIVRPGLALLREGAELSPASSELALEALSFLYRRAREEALAGAADASGAVEQALWAVDRLAAPGAEAAEPDAGKRRALLLEAAELPVPDATRVDLLVRAAQGSAPEQAMALYERLLAEHPREERVALPLARLYRTQGKLEELAALTRRRLDHVTSPQARVALAADLSDQLVELASLDEAERVLRASITETGPNEGLARRLVDVLKRQGRTADVVAFWEAHATELRAAGRGSEAATAWQRAASLAQNELGDLARAAASLRHAAREGALEALDPLARLLLKSGAAAEAAQVLERLWQEAPELTGEAGVLLLAEALLAAGEPARAAARLEESRARGQAGERVLAQLAALHRASGDAGALARVLVAQADATKDEVKALGLLVEAGRLELALAAADAAAARRALAILDRALDLAPQELPVRLLRERANLATGDVEGARQNLRALVERAQTRRPKDRAALHHELARVLVVAGDREAALAELDTALRADPTDIDSLVLLARTARELGQLDRAQRAYRSLLVVLKKHAPGQRTADAEAPVTRSEVLLALSEIAEQSGEPERAAEYLESAFDAASGSPEQAHFHAALRRRGRHDLLVRALAAEVEAADAAAQATLLRPYAEALEAAGRREEAARIYLRALDALGPEEALVLAALRAAVAVGRIPALVSRLDGAPAAVRLAAVEELLAADLGAAKALLAGLEPDGADPRVQRLRVRVARAEGDERQEGEALRGLLDGGALSPEERADAAWRIAELSLASAGRPAPLEDFERAWAADPRPDAALRLLGAVVDRGDRSAPVLRALEAAARAAGDDGALTTALLHRAEAEDDAAALRDAIDLATARGALGEIEPRLRARLAVLTPRPAEDEDEWAVDARPTSVRPGAAELAPFLLGTLASVRRAAGDAVGEATDLEALAALEVDPKPTLLRVAELAAGPLADLARAARIYERLHEQEPGARDVWEPLLAVLRRLDDAARLDALLSEVVAFVDEPRERASMLLERAQRKGPDEARALLEGALDEDPTLTAAAVALAEILETKGEADALVELLSRQLDVAKDRGDVPAIESLSSRIAELAERRGDVSVALEAWHGVLDWSESHLGALRAIARLSERSETTLDLSDALERLLGAESGREAADVALRLAELEAARGADDRVLSALEVGFTRSRGDRRLRKELAARYALSRRLDKLAKLSEWEADWIDPDRPAERAAKLVEAAEILLDPDAGRCFDVVRAALAADPRNARALELLGDLGLELGRADEALQALDDAARSGATPELLRRRASLRNAVGRHDEALDDLESAYAATREGGDELAFQLEQKLARLSLTEGAEEVFLRTQSRLAELYVATGQLDAARGVLSDLLKRSPKDRAALRTLASLETEAGGWDAAIAAYRRLISLEEGEALVATALAFAGACERAGRLGDARGGLERALRASPGEPRVRARLREVYLSVEANVELALMIIEDAEATDAPGERFSRLIEAARLLVEPEPERALEVLERARAIRPSDDELVLLGAAALARGGQADEAKRSLLAAAQAKGKRARAAAPLYEALARLELAAGNLSEALESHVRAFECDSQSASLALSLALLAIDLDDQEAANRALRAVTLMKIGAKPGEGATLQQRGLAYHHLAGLSLKQGDPRRARTYVEKALADDPGLTEARELLARLKG